MAISATTVALSIPELLETILLHLEITDLLVSAQRVSKHWLIIITGSTRLQQALFFKPIAPPTNPYEAYKTSPDDDPKSYPNAYRTEIVASFNPLLRRHFGSVFFHPNGCGKFRLSDSFYSELPWYMNGRKETNECESLKDEDGLDRRRRAFSRSGASWRRMVVAQPAQPALGYVWAEINEWLTFRKGYIDTIPTAFDSVPLSQDGLRFGLLYDFVQYHAAHHDGQLEFRVVWGRPHSYSEFLIKGDEISTELLCKTSVIVQFKNRDQQQEIKPVDSVAFDNTFRSHDFRLPIGQETEVFRMLR
ncbi:hypothetical protein BDV18DRAFT_157360 [Aspergillus unguis]